MTVSFQVRVILLSNPSASGCEVISRDQTFGSYLYHWNSNIFALDIFNLTLKVQTFQTSDTSMTNLHSSPKYYFKKINTDFIVEQKGKY